MEADLLLINIIISIIPRLRKVSGTLSISMVINTLIRLIIELNILGKDTPINCLKVSTSLVYIDIVSP